MINGVVAQIRTPTEDELKRMRDLWSALKQKPLPASTERGIELQTYGSRDSDGRDHRRLASGHWETRDCKQTSDDRKRGRR